MPHLHAFTMPAPALMSAMKIRSRTGDNEIMKGMRFFWWIVCGALLVLAPRVQAQWATQTIALKGGWNAVYLHVDASHTNLDQFIGSDLTNPIQEIWLWQPPVPPGQFLDSPQRQTASGTEWGTWKRQRDISSTLTRLTGNAAYLVRVSAVVTSYTWNVKGKPVPPSYRWSLSGLNLIGFPTPPLNPPFSSSFLSPAPELQQTAEIYQYPGGQLGPDNPSQVSSLLYRSTQMPRGQAYWMRAGETFNRYFGPFEVTIESYPSIKFGDELGQARLRIRNQTDSAIQVTLRQIISEAAPPGLPVIVGQPPLLLRGALVTNGLTFTYTYTNLSAGAQTWTLTPMGQSGSEVEVILGLNRSQMVGAAGDLFAAMLRFTDSLNLSQVDVGVSAEVAGKSGLWIGGAQVEYVSHYLKKFAQATNDTDLASLLQRLQLTNGVGGVRYVRDPSSGR
ncbi:MAG: hypothetical protein H7X97_01395, partial [Opitutaceae bacterium]|nr:hypothetical protein [Verrucomicrobiales bacterium]